MEAHFRIKDLVVEVRTCLIVLQALPTQIVQMFWMNPWAHKFSFLASLLLSRPSRTNLGGWETGE
jgi:hypothetical protein